jgi:2-polyprenyl-3-methyl-5-hydroxy-6-metoxy-1,4-benzoquinol methylase
MMLEEHTVSGLQAALLPCVQPLAGVEPDPAIADLACGTGAWLERLYGAGYRELVGVDRDVAVFGASDIATFIPLDLDADNAIYKIAASKFALVTMIEVIEHVANPQHLVDIAFRALIGRAGC